MDRYLALLEVINEMNEMNDDSFLYTPVLRRQTAIYVDQESMANIKSHIKNKWEFDNVSNLCVVKVQEFFNLHNYLPTKFQFIKDKIENCACGISLDDHDLAVTTGIYLLERLEEVPDCLYIQHAIHYTNQEHREPTIDELNMYILNTIRINEDPESYYHETKQSTPTPNLSSLKQNVCDADYNCGLCFENLKDEACYVLPCNHVFHSDKEKCIDATVLDWLKNNRTCPVCKQEVVLQ